MSAEVLREAAALMRSRAEAATPGPWEAVNCEFAPKLGSYSLVHDNKAEVAIDRAGWRNADVVTPNAEHIASWHPAVALAVADWLENVARFVPIVGAPEESFVADAWMTSWDDAINVARAYLGRAS